ncbi:hypothetical protein A2U01_0071713, partial [Trifolium medium]|nr:hypothetical protein [Trifolium medium]
NPPTDDKNSSDDKNNKLSNQKFMSYSDPAEQKTSKDIPKNPLSNQFDMAYEGTVVKEIRR